MIYLIFIIGTILGSFYLVVATRLPINENIINSRSHCDHCQKKLKWYNLIPIFSYLFQLGKCTQCKKKIAPIHLIVELVTGFLFAILFYFLGFSYDFYVGIIVASLLIIICISDFKYMIILDSPLVISAILVFALQLYFHGFKIAGLSLIAGNLMFFLMLGIKKTGDFIFKRESLGGGDIKFSFVIGLILGLRLSIVALILSAFLALPASIASVLTSKNREVPYGPFLAGALFIIFIFMDKFINMLNYLIA